MVDVYRTRAPEAPRVPVSHPLHVPLSILKSVYRLIRRHGSAAAAGHAPTSRLQRTPIGDRAAFWLSAAL
jgi:hypothetical protein